MDRVDGRKRRGEATRRAVLSAARRLLRTEGTEVTLEALAAAVGLTRQAVLHHFPSKERVFVDLAVEALELERDAAIAAIGRKRGRSALNAFVRGLFRFYVSDIERFRLVYLRGQLVADALVWFPPAERAERLYPVTGRMYAVAAEAVAKGAPDVDARALVVSAHLAAVGFATQYGLTEANGDPMTRSFETYLDAFLATWSAGLGRA